MFPIKPRLSHPISNSFSIRVYPPAPEKVRNVDRNSTMNVGCDSLSGHNISRLQSIFLILLCTNYIYFLKRAYFIFHFNRFSTDCFLVSNKALDAKLKPAMAFKRGPSSARNTVKTRIKEPPFFGVRLSKVLKLQSFKRTFRPNVR